MTTVQQALIDCFAQSKGCRIVLNEGLNEGAPVEFIPGSLSIFSGGIEGDAVDGHHWTLALEQIDRVEPLEG